MKISNLWLRLDAVRRDKGIYFSAFVCSGPRDDFAVETTSSFSWKVGVLGNFAGRAKTGKSKAGQFQILCTGRNISKGWALVEIRQTSEAIVENFGIALEDRAPTNTITSRLEPLPSTLHSLAYIASYHDLILTLEDDERLGRSHYRERGRFEKRCISFRPHDYAASHSDLFQLVANPVEATRHYLKTGFKEGRPICFDAYLYGAGYRDLAEQFGSNAAALAQHYVSYGFAEGRHCENFDWKAYIASAPEALHSASAAAKHYLQHLRPTRLGR
jgi:hypothetical protein